MYVCVFYEKDIGVEREECCWLEDEMGGEHSDSEAFDVKSRPAAWI